MQSLTPLHPRPASSRFFKLCARYLSSSTPCQEASYRRSRSKLNIKPDPSFLPTKTEQHDHIIYNPPPSMPNMLHTPTIFLPKDDKRRHIRAASAAALPSATIGAVPALPAGALPPPVRPPYQKRYHLTEEDVREIRRLGREHPEKWTRTTLAKKFDCSSYFITMVFDGMNHKRRAVQRDVTAAVKSHWGVKRRTAREDRQLRKERWYKDA